MSKKNKKQQSSKEDWKDKLLKNKHNIIGHKSETSDAKISLSNETEHQSESMEISKQSIQLPASEYLICVDTDQYYIDQVSPIVDKITREASAPYNFIPLNSKIVLSDFDITKKAYQYDKYHTDKNTGYIKVNIETRTPVYIRDTFTKDQLKVINLFDEKIEKAKKDRNKEKLKLLKNQKTEKLWEYSDFFSPAIWKLRIPGSTQRGLIKNVVAIASYGKFMDFEDKRLYFRGLADQSNLQSEYITYGLSEYRRYQILCGILKKEGLDYYLYETGAPGQITFADAENKINNSGFQNFDPREMKSFPIASENYYIVVSGQIGGRSRKLNHWTVDFKNSTTQRILVDKMDIKDYEDDENRADNVIDLLKEAESIDGTPCFYTKRIEIKDSIKKTRIYFGHTGMFRVPYRKTIGEHIPNELKQENKPDIPEAIFGNKSTFAGRVYFEDAFCNIYPSTDALMSAKHPQILSGPKPTTFQHYLTQPCEDKSKLKHYNTDSEKKLSFIRGYKQYWHKNGNDWIENIVPNERNKKQYTKINPVKEKTTFTGCIRFENLSDVELGALLFALDLPYEKNQDDEFISECCHKIGMGKPLGLGSIRITPTLHLSKRKERYMNLESEWSTNLEDESKKTDSKKIEDLKDAFATYILNQLRNNKESYKSKVLWEEEPRMQELNRMLDFKNKPANNKTRYMEIKHQKLDQNGNKLFKKIGEPDTENEFRNRPVLPKPKDVK
jgi:hypothetical protein